MIKRIVDIFVAALSLLLLFVPIVFISGVILYSMGRPILFNQDRPGFKKKTFKLVKFRTMTVDRSPDGALLPDSQRLTSLGRLLRSTSLDELPTLWNVLKGDMSLVGPRPLLVEYLPLYSKEQDRRHEVKPGITGWAQINGRNNISWEDKFKLDVWYVDNSSFLLDLKILAVTILKVIKREGITKDGEGTVNRFKGTY